MPTLGSLLFQIPISAASDDIDRRGGRGAGGVHRRGGRALCARRGPDQLARHVAMVLIGGTTFPLYSIAGAYTNDWVPTEKLTAAASQLVVLFGAGAFVGPFVASIVMDLVGTDGFVWTTSASTARSASS